MDDTPIIGEFSLLMMYDAMKETQSGLKEHCRTHKEDIDKIHGDNAEIKESISELNKTVALLAQKIESAPQGQTPPKDGILTSWKAAAAGAIVLIAGIVEGLQYVKKM